MDGVVGEGGTVGTTEDVTRTVLLDGNSVMVDL